MTDTEMNIAIAKACGWTDIKVCPGQYIRMLKPRGRKTGYTWSHRRAIPDYCHDLNAMREATSTLMDGELIGFVDQLLCVIHEVDGGYFNRVEWAMASDLITATPKQGAEAFLRLKGLWRE